MWPFAFLSYHGSQNQKRNREKNHAFSLNISKHDEKRVVEYCGPPGRLRLIIIIDDANVLFFYSGAVIKWR